MNPTRNVLITGGSSDMGRAIAVALAPGKTKIFVVARSKQRLEETARAVESAGGVAVMIVADLRKPNDIERVIDNVRRDTQSLDVLVHVAGVWHNDKMVYAGIPLAETPEEQIREVLEVGITAPMVLTRGMLPLMIPNKRGKIIAISGTFASGGAGWLHYYVSKLALEHFAVGLSQELRQHEIQVNCISPSDTNTDALRKFFPDDATTAIEPSEIGKLCSFLASSDADNITGQCIVLKSKKVY